MLELGIPKGSETQLPADTPIVLCAPHSTENFIVDTHGSHDKDFGA